MQSFPAHLRSCAFGSLIRFPLAAGGEGLGRLAFARGRLDDPHLGLALVGADGALRRDERNQPIVVPVKASLCRPAPDADLAQAPAARLAQVRARAVA